MALRYFLPHQDRHSGGDRATLGLRSLPFLSRHKPMVRRLMLLVFVVIRVKVFAMIEALNVPQHPQYFCSIAFTELGAFFIVKIREHGGHSAGR